LKVLVIGSGGREHALVWKITQSEMVSKIYTIPGNGGTHNLSENVSLNPEDTNELVNFVKRNKVDLTIVGPEKPLVDGIVDEFNREDLRIFGPSREASQIEGSKVFAKLIMAKYGIPTADFEIFDNPEKAKKYVYKKGTPIVIKADGLAAGKGSYVCKNFKDADKAINDIMIDKIFGKAGDKIVVEEFLTGEEASVFAITDGKNFITLPSSQDHKPIYNGDKGPNTGGMGAYSPAPVVSKYIYNEVKDKIIVQTFEAMEEEGIPYKGVLYCGLMITRTGPKVVEFNCRFGDPETQVVLPLIENDIVDVINKAVEGKLDNVNIRQRKGFAVTVVLASGGYPGKYEKGKVISGIEKFENDKNFIIFQAGTKYKEGKYLTNGGRVLNVTCIDNTLVSTIDKVYSNIDKIKFEKVYFRTDIGKKGLKYCK